jgi:hypothetical protein
MSIELEDSLKHEQVEAEVREEDRSLPHLL